MRKAKYGLVAINDDESVCAVCGKVELKRVMWLVALSPEDGNSWDGEPFPVGTTCGARMLGYTTGKMHTKAKNYTQLCASKRIEIGLRWAQAHGRTELAQALNDLNLSPGQRVNHPLMRQIHELDEQGKAYAATQAITMEL